MSLVEIRPSPREHLVGYEVKMSLASAPIWIAVLGSLVYFIVQTVKQRPR